MKLMNKKLSLIILLLANMLFSSCATYQRIKNYVFTTLPPKKFALIESNPAGAEVVTAKGEVVGATPLKITGEDLDKFAKDGIVSFVISKVGFVPREIVVLVNGIDLYNVELTPLNPDHFEKWVLKTYGDETNEMLRQLLQIQGFLFLQKFPLAENKITDFQKKYPNVAASYTMLGNIYYHQNKYPEARAQLLRALSIDGKDETTIRFLEAVNNKLSNL